MNARRWVGAAAVVVAAAGGGVAVSAAGAARGATSTVYSRTVYGPDFHGLDHRLLAQFLPNTGGGVHPVAPAGDPTLLDFEAPVDLPVGANVTSVSFFYRDCAYFGTADGAFYFGSYKPSAGQFTYHLPEAVGDFGDCAARYTYTRAKPTIATVAADRRYVLGAHVFIIDNDDNTNPSWILYGARVRYTCPTTCT